ncbi:MAG: type I-F CRISPR-associated endoribonuclease Cas6/Csy4 [Lysobacter sp.]|nr:type I-F CRISPR-associated endoribonuclease Cas6/Csy4 [Lysobacter sp.]
MDHYIDIEVRPDGELAANHLMGALYANLHRALVRMECSALGVSFPRHDDAAPSIGNCLRLHGTCDALAALMSSQWLSGVRDHLNIHGPSPLPVVHVHRRVRRVQPKSNPARMRRRLVRRHGISAEEALQKIPDSAAELVRLPFIQVRSTSTEQTFRLFVAHDPDQIQAVPGAFNAYGLSQTATIPWF